MVKRIHHIILGLFLAIAATTAHAGCSPIPENDVWGKVSNDAIARYVEQQGGDWASYIGKWEARLKRVQRIAEKNSVMVFHKSDLWLRGSDLERYVRDVQQRLASTRCMALNANGSTAPGEALAGSPSADGT